MTLIALPTMLRQGYDPKLATGTIAASGTLGQRSEEHTSELQSPVPISYAVFCLKKKKQQKYQQKQYQEY